MSGRPGRDAGMATGPALVRFEVYVRLDVDGKTFSVPFRVLEYRKPEFTVSVTPEKRAYLTGEEVRAKVRLEYAFGGPVAGAPVTWEVVRVPRDFAPSAVDDEPSDVVESADAQVALPLGESALDPPVERHLQLRSGVAARTDLVQRNGDSRTLVQRLAA